jgi:hypothetical protein
VFNKIFRSLPENTKSVNLNPVLVNLTPKPKSQEQVKQELKELKKHFIGFVRDKNREVKQLQEEREKNKERAKKEIKNLSEEKKRLEVIVSALSLDLTQGNERLETVTIAHKRLKLENISLNGNLKIVKSDCEGLRMGDASLRFQLANTTSINDQLIKNCKSFETELAAAKNEIEQLKRQLQCQQEEQRAIRSSEEEEQAVHSLRFFAQNSKQTEVLPSLPSLEDEEVRQEKSKKSPKKRKRDASPSQIQIQQEQESIRLSIARLPENSSLPQDQRKIDSRYKATGFPKLK